MNKTEETEKASDSTERLPKPFLCRTGLWSIPGALLSICFGWVLL